MLRMYFLQQWFNLSDPAVEEALYDSVVMRDFVGIDLGREPVPDETTVCKFRHLLEEHRLGGEMLETVNLHLEDEGCADHYRHDRRCNDHSCAEFDEEPRAEARPGNAPDEERQPVVLRDEGTRGCGQQDEDDSLGGGYAGQCGRCAGCCRSCCTGKRPRFGATKHIAGRAR